MPGFRHPRIASALFLAVFWGSGVLVGTNAQRAQAPEGGASPTEGVETRAPAVPKPDFPSGLEMYVDIPPSSVLVDGGSGYVVDRDGVLILPLSGAVGVYTTTSVTHSLVAAVVPVQPTAEFRFPPKDFF